MLPLNDPNSMEERIKRFAAQNGINVHVEDGMVLIGESPTNGEAISGEAISRIAQLGAPKMIDFPYLTQDAGDTAYTDRIEIPEFEMMMAMNEPATLRRRKGRTRQPPTRKQKAKAKRQRKAQRKARRGNR